MDGDFYKQVAAKWQLVKPDAEGGPITHDKNPWPRWWYKWCVAMFAAGYLAEGISIPNHASLDTFSTGEISATFNENKTWGQEETGIVFIESSARFSPAVIVTLACLLSAVLLLAAALLTRASWVHLAVRTHMAVSHVLLLLVVVQQIGIIGVTTITMVLLVAVLVWYLDLLMHRPATLHSTIPILLVLVLYGLLFRQARNQASGRPPYTLVMLVVSFINVFAVVVSDAVLNWWHRNHTGARHRTFYYVIFQAVALHSLVWVFYDKLLV